MASIFTPTSFDQAGSPQRIDLTDCMGDSVSVINANTNYLASFTTAVSSATRDVVTTVNTLLSTRVFQSESSFVYSADVKSGTSGLTNQWQDIFIDKDRTPMRVSFVSPNIPTTAVIVSNIHLRNYMNAFSSWMRIGRFASSNRNTHPNPLDVITETSSEGHVSYSESNNINMLTFIPLTPNTPYTFGVQSYFYQNTGNPANSRIEVNGWHTADANGDGSPTLRNRLNNINSWSNVYAESPSVTPIAPTQNIGIGNSSTSAINKVRNLSYLRVVLL